MSKRKIPCVFLTKEQGGYTISEIQKELKSRGVEVSFSVIRQQINPIKAENKYLGYRQGENEQAVFVYSEEVFKKVIAHYAQLFNMSETKEQVSNKKEEPQITPEKVLSGELVSALIQAITGLHGRIELLRERINALSNRVFYFESYLAACSSKIKDGKFAENLDRIANALENSKNAETPERQQENT